MNLCMVRPGAQLRQLPRCPHWERLRACCDGCGRPSTLSGCTAVAASRSAASPSRHAQRQRQSRPAASVGAQAALPAVPWRPRSRGLPARQRHGARRRGRRGGGASGRGRRGTASGHANVAGR